MREGGGDGETSDKEGCAVLCCAEEETTQLLGYTVFARDGEDERGRQATFLFFCEEIFYFSTILCTYLHVTYYVTG